MMMAITPLPILPSDAALPALPTLADDAFAALFAEALPSDAALPKDPAPPIDAPAPEEQIPDVAIFTGIVPVPPTPLPELFNILPPTPPLPTPAPTAASPEALLALVHAGAARRVPTPPMVEQPAAPPLDTLAKLPPTPDAGPPSKPARPSLTMPIPAITDAARAPSPVPPVLLMQPALLGADRVVPTLDPVNAVITAALALPQPLSAPATPPPAPSLPLDPARLAGQLAAALPRLQRNGDARVLTLDPARLGRVTLRWVDDADGAPHLTIRAAEAPTAALLGQHSAAIAVAVREAGGLAAERASDVRITISADSASAMPNMLTDSDRRAPARPHVDPQALLRRAVIDCNDAVQAVPEPRSKRASGHARLA